MPSYKYKFHINAALRKDVTTNSDLLNLWILIQVSIYYKCMLMTKGKMAHAITNNNES